MMSSGIGIADLLGCFNISDMLLIRVDGATAETPKTESYCTIYCTGLEEVKQALANLVDHTLCHSQPLFLYFCIFCFEAPLSVPVREAFYILNEGLNQGVGSTGGFQ